MSSQVPAWFEIVRRRYVAGEASVFLLHGNVYDEVFHEGKRLALPQFLSDMLKQANKETVLYYEPSNGLLALHGKPMDNRLPGTLDDDPLMTAELTLRLQNRVGLIIAYAGSVTPSGQENFLSERDRTNAIRVHRWSLERTHTEKDNIVFLLAETLTEIHQRLVSNPRIAVIEIPLPDEAGRSAIIRDIDPFYAQRAGMLAAHTAGLKGIHLRQILKPKQEGGMPDTARLAHIRLLLEAQPDGEARAQRFLGLTAGMTEAEITHLIKPGEPQAKPVGAMDAEVMALIHKRKREIIEKECAGLVEFMDAKHDLSAVGGAETVKAELYRIARIFRSGDRHRAPMGLLMVGAMGTGKTFVTRCFAKESGLTALTLKNFRSKWVGDTEANLEKVLGVVKAMGPVILVIDEGDRSFGSASEDSDGGTSSRVIARLKEFMSDTDNRGQVLFVLMTNRPDKLDVDIKRAGRLDIKLPLFYAETVEEIRPVLQALFARAGIIDNSALNDTTLIQQLLGYSNAELEALVLEAVNRADGPQQVSASIFLEAVKDYLPSRDQAMLEYMELLAVFEASKRSFLPLKWRDIQPAVLTEKLASSRLLALRRQG